MKMDEIMKMKMELPPMNPLVGKHVSSQDEFGLYKAAKNVWKFGGKESKALCALHAFDYACFDDILPDGIPQLCSEVYSTW